MKILLFLFLLSSSIQAETLDSLSNDDIFKDSAVKVRPKKNHKAVVKEKETTQAKDESSDLNQTAIEEKKEEVQTEAPKLWDKPASQYAKESIAAEKARNGGVMWPPKESNIEPVKPTITQKEPEHLKEIKYENGHFTTPEEKKAVSDAKQETVKTNAENQKLIKIRKETQDKINALDKDVLKDD